MRLQNLLGDQIGIYLNILTLSSFVALGPLLGPFNQLSNEIFVKPSLIPATLRQGKKWLIGDKENQIENGYFQEIISTNRPICRLNSMVETET